MEEGRNFTEELFDAIQTIVNGSVSSLNYDETISCTIVDNTNRARGEYIVSDGSSTFIAYSDVTTYGIETNVYVTIPMGDYNNKKIILGRRTSSDSPYFNYVAPTQTYVDITKNIVTSTNDEPFSILANGPNKMKLIFTTEEDINYKGYDRLGVKANFRTFLSDLKPITGSYGLYLKVTSHDEITPGEKIITNFWLGQDEMYGNIYNFNTFFEQEAVYDISSLGSISQIQVFLYQLSDFKSKKAETINDIDVYIPHTNIITIGKNEIEETLPDNIFTNELYISFGYDLNNFTEDKVIAYTLNSMEYSSEDSSDERKRNLEARWIHKLQDGTIVSVDNEDKKLEDYNANLYWYHYVLDDDIKTEYGGQYWENITAKDNNPFSCEVNCSTSVQDEFYKAVVILPSQERINLINELIANIESGDYITSEDAMSLSNSLNKFNEEFENREDNFKEVAGSIYQAIEDCQGKNDKWESILKSFLDDWTNLPLYDTYSDIITIHNTSMVQANLAVDLVQAITITVADKDGRNGIFNIYGEDGQILNSNYSVSRHKLLLNYNSLLTGMAEFDGDGSEIVTWKFPLNNTMIQTPAENIEYELTSNGNLDNVKDKDGNDIPIYTKDNEFVYIRKVINKSDEELTVGGFQCKTTEQIFRIKDYYSAGGNNTIYCMIDKGGYTYTASITLVFGTAGTNGTNYTFRLNLEATAENRQPIKVTPSVYDYNNQPVLISEIDYSWYGRSATNSEGAVLTLSQDEQDKNCCIINGNSSAEEIAHKFNILKARAEILETGVKLETYLPIPWSANLETCNHFEGPDRIIYDSSGINPSFYKGKFKLYTNLDEEVENIKWSIEIEKGELSKEQKFYPSVTSKKVTKTVTEYYLKAPSMFLKDNALCSLVGKNKNDSIIWCQPLLIMQNRYSSALLNSWCGDVVVDEEAGTIMSPMLGAGKKNSDNSFSGVLIGDVNKADIKEQLTGVYGYQKGQQSFSLTEDGIATFGVSGKGQIIIDGQGGYIESGTHKIDNKTGMKIDLESGAIDAYNFKLTSKYITLNSAPGVNNYFTIKGSGTVPITTYKYDDNGLITKDSNEAIEGITQEDKVIEGKTLINVGNSSFYLQTLNYDPVKENGLKFDLTEGKLIAYDGFTLKATNHMVKIKDDEVEETQVATHYIQVIEKFESDNKKKYKKVHTPITDININNYKNYYFLYENGNYLNEWDKIEDLKLYADAKITEKEYQDYLKDYYYKKDESLEDTDSGNYEKINESGFDPDKVIYKIGINGTYKPDEGNIMDITNGKIYKKEIKKSYIKLNPINEPTFDSKKVCYWIKDKILKAVDKDQEDGGQYYEVSKGTVIYYYEEAQAETAESYGTFKRILDNNIDKDGLEVSDSAIYINSGDYKAGVLTIDAMASEYPIKLTLGNDIPFKLSWAGYLNTSKLKATGGTIGGWEISNNSLTSRDKQITLKSSSSKDDKIPVTYYKHTNYDCNEQIDEEIGGAAIILGQNPNPQKKIYYSLPTEDTIPIERKEEGNYTVKELGKYVKTPSDVSPSGYYLITSAGADANNSYEMTQDRGKLVLSDNGNIYATNLYIKGGDGQWGGSCEFANRTHAWTHTHNLSGKLTFNKASSDLNLYSITRFYDDGISLQQVTQVGGTVTYTGNSSSGLSVSDTTIGTLIAPTSTKYYTKAALDNAALKGQGNYATRYTMTVKVGLKSVTKTVYAYRSGEKSIAISENWWGGYNWV